MYLCKFLNTHPLVSRDVCIGQAKVFSCRAEDLRCNAARRRRHRHRHRVPWIKEFAILNFRWSHTYAVRLYPGRRLAFRPSREHRPRPRHVLFKQRKCIRDIYIMLQPSSFFFISFYFSLFRHPKLFMLSFMHLFFSGIFAKGNSVLS